MAGVSYMRRIHLLIIVIIIIVSYFVSWHLIPVRELPFLVVDKTVPETDYREHRVIFWLAKHWRIAGETGEFLQAEKDYLGYHPETDRRENLTSGDLDGIRLLYLADTYGIYNYEEGLEEYEEKLPHEEQPVTLDFGGFNLKETEVIEDFARRDNAMLVGEHNIFAYPTYTEPEASEKLQDLFGVKYEGWLLRYFPHLDEVAFWIKQLYTRMYGKEWDFDGPGIVIIREDVPLFGWQEDLLIFQAEDFTGAWPTVHNMEHPLTDGAACQVPYLYWMEILNPVSGADVLTYYELPFKEESVSGLERRGLSTRIPAMVHYQPKNEGTRIYFAGDFADQLRPILPAGLTGSASIQRFLTYLPGLPVEYRFCFRWYAPVLNNIMEEAMRQ